MSASLFPDAEERCSKVVHLLHRYGAALLRVGETVPGGSALLRRVDPTFRIRPATQP